MDILESKEFMPAEFIESETKWFYTSLGIDDAYFKSETAEAIANQILSLYAAKVAAFSRDDKRLEIRLDRETEGSPSSPSLKLVFPPLVCNM